MATRGEVPGLSNHALEAGKAAHRCPDGDRRARQHLSIPPTRLVKPYRSDVTPPHDPSHFTSVTGITPYHAAEKGFVQDTWGIFQGNMFAGAKKGELAMIALWQANPQKPLPFQFGYPDKNEHDHMMVTRKK